jgi:hypothetical protein
MRVVILPFVFGAPVGATAVGTVGVALGPVGSTVGVLVLPVLGPARTTVRTAVGAVRVAVIPV